MSNGIFIGIFKKDEPDAAGVRKVKKIYIGNGEKNVEVSKVWIGTKEGNKLCYTSAFEFSYTGNYKFSGSADGDWVLSLLTSGTLTVRSAPTPIDVFCCGGGGNGGSGTDWNGYGGTHYDGGNGGKGGGCSYKKGITIKEGTETVQVGNRGESSYAYGVIGSYAGGGLGGTHGEFDGSSGHEGALIFDEPNFPIPDFDGGYRFGAGGGGGASGVRWDDGREPAGSPGRGGYHGGGRGADYYSGGSYAQNGTENSGGGGGGGCGPYHPSGGYGASGIVVIRNAR